ncbi:class F sortase [Nocardia concava]|uniref:class F sortase n=1 Tax=Nocardia concava TaxID=257281 RepID=UPI001C3F34F0|nr:class F sortase [Nocardia concava]
MTLSAAGLFAGAVHSGDHRTHTPPSAANTASGAAVPSVATLSRSAPIALTIAAIDLNQPLDRIGLNADNTIEDPATFEHPSWFRSGPAPGERGSAVIIGHVDSYRGPAAFFRLGNLKPGDPVDVARADGAVAHFAVIATETVDKNDFPAESVYGNRPDSELVLVTCGGEFDSARRSYRSNVIVYTHLIGASGTTSGG